jgi:hypothetical protein
MGRTRIDGEGGKVEAGGTDGTGRRAYEPKKTSASV